jgi:hygromycin-B 7''-O-kinase
VPYGQPVMLLPAADTQERYDEIADTELAAGARALCAELGLAGVEVRRFAAGSMPVYAVGADRVLKLYPRFCRQNLDIEVRALGAVEGKLSIPTPRVQASGEVDGWGYVLMDRLPGISLKDAWPHIPPAARDKLVEQLGVVLAELHALTPPDLPPADWPAFVAAQSTSALDRQCAKGLEERWLAQIPGFLDSVVLEPTPPVLLHTEVMPAHLQVVERDGVWSWAGLLDFEPAMRGGREYEFVSVGVFLTRGDAALLRRMLSAYGYGAAEFEDLPRRLMAYTLLHVYANLPWYLREIPPVGAVTFDQLAQRWFSC